MAVWWEAMAFVSTLLSLTQTRLKQCSPVHPSAAGLQGRWTWCSVVQPPAEKEKTAFSPSRTTLCPPPCLMARARLLPKCRFNRILHHLRDLVLRRSTGWGHDMREHFAVRERKSSSGESSPTRSSMASLHARNCFFLGSKLLVNNPTHMSRLGLFYPTFSSTRQLWGGMGGSSFSKELVKSCSSCLWVGLWGASGWARAVHSHRQATSKLWLNHHRGGRVGKKSLVDSQNGHWLIWSWGD